MKLSSELVLGILSEADYCGPLPEAGFKLNEHHRQDILLCLCEYGLLEKVGVRFDITELGQKILNNSL